MSDAGNSGVVSVASYGATVTLVLDDGAGPQRPFPLDWPVTARSRQRWEALAAATGVAQIDEPQQLVGRCVVVELLYEQRRVGRIFAATETL